MQKTGVNTTTIAPDFSQSMGSLTINSGTLAFQNGFSTAGSAVLNGGNISSVESMSLSGTLSGVGTLTFTGAAGVLNSGTVNPGVDNVPGKLTIAGIYTQLAAGTLVINVDTAGNFSVLAVQGAATLAGTLTVNENYEPAAGTDLPFLTYNSVTGDFSSKAIQGPQMWTDPNHGEGFDHWSLEENTNSYDLVVVYQP